MVFCNKRENFEKSAVVVNQLKDIRCYVKNDH